MAGKNVNEAFKAAMALDSKVDAARKALDKAMSDRSEAVKAVSVACNGSKGPFTYKGTIYTIRARKLKEENEKGEKVETGEVTWFFVQTGNAELTTIE